MMNEKEISGENSQAAAGEQCCPLVDSDLSPDLKRVGNSLAMSLTEHKPDRIISVFHGCNDYQNVMYEVSSVNGLLMLECLSKFVHRTGGKIVWSFNFEPRRNEVTIALLHAVTVDGKSLFALEHGSLFFQFDQERVVVSAELCSPLHTYTIIVSSNVDSAGFWSRWKEFTKENNYLLGRAFFADGELIERKHAYTWEDILLPETTKKTVQTHVQTFFEQAEKLKALGVKSRRGLILAGLPGTGKTLVGKILADTLKVSFLWVSPRHIENSDSFRRIMDIARLVAPVVVFWEDIDLFAMERGEGEAKGLGELMNQLDGAQDNEGILTIATTNQLEVVETALRSRPGRFDRVIEFGVMDEFCRRRLLTRLLTRAQIEEENLNALVKATSGYTGAEVEELVNTLYILAVQADNEEAKTGERVAISRQLIKDAFDDMRREEKRMLGFNAA